MRIIGIILNNKWIILIASELIAWFLLFLMGYFRYWKSSKIGFTVSTVLSVCFGYIPHFGIPILMCIEEGNLGALYSSKEALLFDLLIISLILFGITKGKQLVIKIDSHFQEKFKVIRANQRRDT